MLLRRRGENSDLKRAVGNCTMNRRDRRFIKGIDAFGRRTSSFSDDGTSSNGSETVESTAKRKRFVFSVFERRSRASVGDEKAASDTNSTSKSKSPYFPQSPSRATSPGFEDRITRVQGLTHEIINELDSLIEDDGGDYRAPANWLSQYTAVTHPSAGRSGTTESRRRRLQATKQNSSQSLGSISTSSSSNRTLACEQSTASKVHSGEPASETHRVSALGEHCTHSSYASLPCSGGLTISDAKSLLLRYPETVGSIDSPSLPSVASTLGCLADVEGSSREESEDENASSSSDSATQDTTRTAPAPLYPVSRCLDSIIVQSRSPRVAEVMRKTRRHKTAPALRSAMKRSSSVEQDRDDLRDKVVQAPLTARPDSGWRSSLNVPDDHRRERNNKRVRFSLSNKPDEVVVSVVEFTTSKQDSKEGKWDHGKKTQADPALRMCASEDLRELTSGNSTEVAVGWDLE